MATQQRSGSSNGGGGGGGAVGATTCSSSGSGSTLYRIEEANLGVILTAPHGGRSKDGDLERFPYERTAYPNSSKVSTKSDLNTLELAALIDEKIQQKLGLGLKPHTVASTVHRRFVDLNRNIRRANEVAVPREEQTHQQQQHQGLTASSSSGAGGGAAAGAGGVGAGLGEATRVYHEYHNKIEQAIAHAASFSPCARVLLLDIHGQAQAGRENTLCVGIGSPSGPRTCNESILRKPLCGFLWHLELLAQETSSSSDEVSSSSSSIRVECDVPTLTGGYTVQRYGLGSQTGGCVDAIQLEFSSSMRSSRASRERSAELIAEAVFRYLRPLTFFLHRSEFGWTRAQTQMVQDKLSRIAIFTLAQLESRLATLNNDLAWVGEKKMHARTLNKMRQLLAAASFVAPTSCAALSSDASCPVATATTTTTTTAASPAPFVQEQKNSLFDLFSSFLGSA